MNLSDHISLVGFMGSGKSTIGKHLSHALQRPLLDTDSLIEARQGKSIMEIFSTGSEAKFREYEYQLLLELVHHPCPSIIVCGGGTPCFYGIMDLLNMYTLSIYLYTPTEILYARLKNEMTLRPLLQKKENLKQFIDELLLQREKEYQKAQVKIATAGKSIEEIIAEIKRCKLKYDV